MTRRRLGWVLLILDLAAIAFLTLLRGDKGVVLSHWCFTCGSLWLTDFLLNGLLFLPLGVALQLLTRSVAAATLIGGAVSLWIELSQRFLLEGRVASTGDLFSNTAGTLAGAAITAFAATLLSPEIRTARRLTIPAAGLWLAILASASAGTQRSFGDRELWGQWAPELGHLDHFRGNLLNGTLGTDPFPWNRADDSHRLRASLMSDAVDVTATVIPAMPTARVAPVLSIFDASYAEILLLGQRGTDAVFRVRTRSADYGLLVPEVVLRGIFPGWFASSPLSLMATIRGSTLAVSGERARESQSRTVALGLGPAVAWMMILPPSRLPALVVALLTAAWPGIALLPGAYWLGAAKLSARLRWGIASVVIATGLGVIPVTLHVAPAPATTWVMTVLLVISGALLGSRTRGLGRRVTVDEAEREEAAAAL